MADEIKNKDNVPSIRTLKYDLEAYAKRAKISFANSSAKEHASQEKEKNAVTPERHGLKALMITGVSLIIILGSVGAYYFSKSRPKETAKITPPPASLIASDKKEAIKFNDANHNNLLQEFTNKLLSPIKDGTFEIVLLETETSGVETFINANQFFRMAEFNLPPDFESNITDYSLGFFRSGSNIRPFLILKTASPSNTFTSMLKWEKNMPNDLRLLFRNTSQSGASNEIFTGAVIKNQDARILNFGGNSILAYAFYNKNLLIITDSENSLSQIISRYAVFPPR